MNTFGHRFRFTTFGGGGSLLAHVRFRAMAAGSSGPERNRSVPSIAP